ncbi:GntR family transcriptional regulator [Aureimonas leprariae]|uniref:GntR family transcriptional regulator n=1 Tax=Plantimonas leprariae TaxID=2615207 RepID=A0A7V7PMR6_9HYPH|nr:GntR family transcriptional regulator [Aureimonas leprariae]KAB0678564.1 GntR family transcriptional regulator [Aureimonas leprariae]
MSVEPGESAAKRIEREIRKAIITLELRPGLPLSEKELAERYGVSRQPVREAFINLARAGLVEIFPRSGTVVAKISIERMLEARFIRESLEVAVVRRACERFDARVRNRIDYLLDVQEVAAEGRRHYEFQRADELFHSALAEGAGCPSAWTVIGDIKAHMDRVCHLTLPADSALPGLIAQHRAIVAAIDRRDAEAAEAELRRHLGVILAALPAVEAAHREIFA